MTYEIVLPQSLTEIVKDLDDSDAGLLLKSILAHYNGEEFENSSLVSRMTFNVIKPYVNALMQKQDDKRKSKVLAGKASAKARQERKRKPRRDVIIQDDSKPKVKSIEERKLEFKKRILQFQSDKYDLALLKDFFIYWSEHADKDTKMRFEKEKTFGVGNRLHTFFRIRESRNNNKKIDKL